MPGPKYLNSLRQSRFGQRNKDLMNTPPPGPGGISPNPGLGQPPGMGMPPPAPPPHMTRPGMPPPNMTPPAPPPNMTRPGMPPPQLLGGAGQGGMSPQGPMPSPGMEQQMPGLPPMGGPAAGMGVSGQGAPFGGPSQQMDPAMLRSLAATMAGGR